MYFIRTTVRQTFTKTLVEADTAEDAKTKEGIYLGVIDANDDKDYCEISGPYTDADTARQSDDGYTEWR